MTKIPLTIRAAAAVGDTSDIPKYGLYFGSVINTNDPLRQGRVLLSVPQVLGTAVSNWAVPLGTSSLLNVTAGQQVGVFFIGGNRNLPAYVTLGVSRTGAATLSAGTVTVSSSIVTANSRIFLAPQDNNTAGSLRISARVPGTSFTITSSNAADTGLVAYEIL